MDCVSEENGLSRLVALVSSRCDDVLDDALCVQLICYKVLDCV